MPNDTNKLDINLQSSSQVPELPLSHQQLLTEIEENISVADNTSISSLERSHRKAVRNWLVKYKAQSNASNKEKVRGYLEAFHHLCQIEKWKLAFRVLFVLPESSISEDLHNLLGTWGYLSERLELYKGLLGKLASKQEVILLDGLSHTYHSLGNYQQVIDYCNQYSKIVNENEDSKRRARVLGILGITYHALGNYQVAVEYNKQRLNICHENNDKIEELNALGDLGITYYSLGDYQSALELHSKQLNMAQELGDKVLCGQALGSLGHVYQVLGRHQEAIKYYEKHLDL